MFLAKPAHRNRSSDAKLKRCTKIGYSQIHSCNHFVFVCLNHTQSAADTPTSLPGCRKCRGNELDHNMHLSECMGTPQVQRILLVRSKRFTAESRASLTFTPRVRLTVEILRPRSREAGWVFVSCVSSVLDMSNSAPLIAAAVGNCSTRIGWSKASRSHVGLLDRKLISLPRGARQHQQPLRAI